MTLLSYVAATEQENVALIGLLAAAVTTIIAPVVLVFVRRRLGPSTTVDPESGEQRPRPTLPEQLTDTHAAIDARIAGLERRQEHTVDLMTQHMTDQSLATGQVMGRIDALHGSVADLAAAVRTMHTTLTDHITKDHSAA